MRLPATIRGRFSGCVNLQRHDLEFQPPDKVNVSVNARQKEGLARLLVGFALNIPLYFLLHQLALWSSTEREVSLCVIGGTLAVATVVFVIPVFWRGAAWQAPLAFVLIFFLPGRVLFSITSVVLKHW